MYKYKIDFSKKKFIKAFKRISLERNKGKPIGPKDDWFMIIENRIDPNTGEDLSAEEKLARLVWKGIDAETEEYSREIDEML